MNKRSISLIILMIAMILLVSCGNDKPSEPAFKMDEKENEETKDELTEISDEVVELTVESFDAIDAVKDSHIDVVDGKVKMYIITEDIGEDLSIELGENLAKVFGDTVAVNGNLKGSTEETYGEIYNEYDLQIMIGISADDIVAQGARAASDKSQIKIRW